jgi:hypothetical protein
MSNKTKVMIATAILILIVATITIFAIPKDVLLGAFNKSKDKAEPTSAVITVKPAADDDDYNELAEKIKSYEEGNKTVFSGEEEYEKAKVYLSSYERHQKWFSEEETTKKSSDKK